MINIINDTYAKFQKIHSLLEEMESTDTLDFGQLSDATQAAYIVMNEGMCVNNTVCQECAQHRDFLQRMIGVVEELENGAPLIQEYRDTLAAYAIMVNETLKKIALARDSL
ncbi:MAG: hypothetical protein NTY39_01230 [Campylobacterales bacterium]|nr:hypothetical protein [Campylobacterales bacterium]